MITVEELIVQSLYHRLVLVTVRRSNVEQSAEGQKEGRHQEAGLEQDSSGIVPENGTLDKGLGNDLAQCL